ncbi:MAG: fibronectin type III domain-containing protein [Spirochaetaceae bacterium]|nr:fibronectin type III domain-containing protein [Spirochaetaceae bacterium]
MKKIIFGALLILMMFAFVGCGEDDVSLGSELSAPTLLYPDKTDDGSIILRWDSVENAYSYYVYYSETEELISSQYEISYDTSYEFVFGDLNFDTKYYFWVKAYNTEVGLSKESNRQSRKTDPYL